MDQSPDTLLVSRLQRGDTAAFDEVHAQLNARLFSFLLRLSRRRDVAEDLLEETWLRLVTHAKRLRPDTRLAPWLFTVARNLYVSHQRSRLLEDSYAAALIGLWPSGTTIVTVRGNCHQRDRAPHRGRPRVAARHLS